MDRMPDNEPPTLRHEPSSMSDYSVDSSSTVVGSPLSPIQHRASYRRVSSFGGREFAAKGIGQSNQVPSAIEESSVARGLGIQNIENARQASFRKGHLANKSDSGTPKSADPLLSPPSAQLGKSHSAKKDYDNPEDPYDFSFSQFSTPSLPQPFSADSEYESLYKKSASTSVGQDGTPESSSSVYCDADRNMKADRRSWLYIAIMMLATYSTIFSGLWLYVACAKPRYGRQITSKGGLSYSTASTLFAAFAKTIELSYVAVFVAFLGQVLSRRALVRKSKGITIAEMSMRLWITQPGTIFTHWETVRYAAFTLLGGLCILATLMAMVYTTASDTLVSPKLKWGEAPEHRIYGEVTTSFANIQHIRSNCRTPISRANDPEGTESSTCGQLEHAGQAYHNYMQYLSLWSAKQDPEKDYTNLNTRPRPVAVMNDSTSVEGSWIHVQNMTEISMKYNRIINNISMAMPHTGVVGASHNPMNNKRIHEPDDTGLGSYNLRASVPSPALNVLCANLSKEELAPMVFNMWPGYNSSKGNIESFPAGFELPTYPNWGNQTSVDDIFGFGKEHGRRHPVFAKLPMQYNTVFNNSGWFTDTVYVLAASPASTYMMCSLRVAQTPVCSTEYTNTMAMQSLVTNCNNATDDLAYSRTVPNATDGVWIPDWASVGTEWGESISLGVGLSDGNASNARLLTQLIPTSYSLSSTKPSIAEALAVLAGCTLMLSAEDAPYIHYWNHTPDISTLDYPEYQSFRAMVSTQEYESGSTQPWQNIFYLVLIIVFATNLMCFFYFLIRGGPVTDFTEPPNLFSLVINSPSSDVLEGSCGSGPQKEQFRATWHIKMNSEREHLYIENSGGLVERKKGRRPPDSGGYELADRGREKQYEKLARKRTSLLGD